MTRKLLLPLLLLLSVASRADGQTEPPEGKAAPQSNPCVEDSRYGEFDFWLGEWEVFVGGAKAGDNVITREEQGCLVLERWTDVAGNTGQSYNFFEPGTGQWRQVWVSRQINIDYSGGLQEDGSMHLVGSMTYRDSGQTVKFQGNWSVLEDGTVRQHFEQWDEKTGAWKALFTGIYKKKS